MAKRKKKKKKALLGSVLKYEIYGIMLITISVIALSGEAAVGRSLSSMAGYLLGRFYFVLPLVGIFYGLMVMIHRRWPSSWNSRHSGVLLLVLSLCLMSSISAMEQKLGPLSMLHPGNVMAQIHTDLSGALSPGSSNSSVYMLGKDISGGYIGALEFAALLWLFGTLGAKLLMIVMMAISFMLVTNLSYVELFSLLRVRAGKLLEGIRLKAANRPAAVPVAARSSRTGRTPAPHPVQELEEDEEEEDEQALPRRSQPLFFRRIGGWLSGTSRTEGQGEEDREEDLTADLLNGPPNSPIISGLDAGRGRASLDNLEDDFAGEELEPVTPIIRDFFEHIRSEGLNEEDREDWSEFSPAARSGNGLRGSVLDGVPADTQATDGDAPEDPVVVELDGLLAAGEDGVPVPAAPLPPPPKPYKLPSFRLLAKPNNGAKAGDQNDYMQTARKLEATLESFGVRAKVLEVVRGPAVTRYEIQPDIGVKVSRIVNLTDDIALALAAKDIRMEAPIPGKSAIGIEVPNSEVSVVTMREVMETQVFQDAESRLSIAFGRDISGQTIVGNLAKMPHLLVAGGYRIG